MIGDILGAPVEGHGPVWIQRFCEEQGFEKINMWPFGAGGINYHFVYHPPHLNVKILVEYVYFHIHVHVNVHVDVRNIIQYNFLIQEGIRILHLLQYLVIKPTMVFYDNLQ